MLVASTVVAESNVLTPLSKLANVNHSFTMLFALRYTSCLNNPWRLVTNSHLTTLRLGLTRFLATLTPNACYIGIVLRLLYPQLLPAVPPENYYNPH